VHEAKVAVGVVGSLVAAFAALLLLGGQPPAPVGFRALPGPTSSAAPAIPGLTDVASAPAAAEPSRSVPDIPRTSAALVDHPVVVPPVPTRLEVPDLGIDVTVQPVGLDDRGRMGLSDDPAIAAWYQWGPAPASPAGSTVIAAHVDSLEYDLLPFARLRDAVAGTQVLVTDAAGTRRGYAVQSVEVIRKADVDWRSAFDRAGDPRLTLVTCGGEFDYENLRYLSNLVVTATPIG
jgi:hypothetical protein